VAITLDERILEGRDLDHPHIKLGELGAIGRSGSRTFVRCIPEAVYFQERPPLPRQPGLSANLA
jgi:hypothetical protein